ncbi:MAG TPA: hypothetical protein VNT58_07005 [Gaiellaceae bacterium]|nr:hypothetical protein [Gaiellaceae bacterium]
MRVVAVATLVLVVAGAGVVGGGRSAVAAALLLPVGVVLAYVFWRALRVARRVGGRRRLVAYGVVAVLALVELWVFVVCLYAAGAIAEALFPFSERPHGHPPAP